MMIRLSLFIFGLMAGFTASSSPSSLRILDLVCNQMGLSNCKVSNCSDVAKISRKNASTGPEWDCVEMKTSMGPNGSVPVMTVAWKLQADASIYTIRGSEIKIKDEDTNQSMCIQFHYSVDNQLNPSYNKWTFSLDAAVEPKHTYTMEVFNFPEPEKGHYRIMNHTAVPGCEDQRIKNAQLCQENGSLWDPRINALFTEKTNVILVAFDSAEYSETYQVFIQCGGLYFSQMVLKENRRLLNVTLEWDICQLLQCEMLITIQPFFIGCKNNCQTVKKTVKYSPTQFSMTACRSIKTCIVSLLIFVGFVVYLLQKASHKGAPTTPTSPDMQQPEVFQVQERKRVLVIYSPDHLLYKNIVLKFSAFLAAKCGTDVILDLLDITRLGILGSIQWLEWHREQIERFSDKILILCSRGVQAKWRAICGGQQICLREDALSPIGDTLTPSLALLVPHFIRSASFEQYIVAYFDDICSEEDIPLPFKITVRYKLMKQFEEVFFRILNTEKHQPGRVKQINGLMEDKYHECPSGRALRDAIEVFSKYQLEHPNWFQEELVESPDLEDEEEPTNESDERKMTVKDNFMYGMFNSLKIITDIESQESGFTVNKTKVQLAETHQICSTLEFNSHTAEGFQLF